MMIECPVTPSSAAAAVKWWSYAAAALQCGQLQPGRGLYFHFIHDFFLSNCSPNIHWRPYFRTSSLFYDQNQSIIWLPCLAGSKIWRQIIFSKWFCRIASANICCSLLVLPGSISWNMQFLFAFYTNVIIIFICSNNCCVRRPLGVARCRNMEKMDNVTHNCITAAADCFYFDFYVITPVAKQVSFPAEVFYVQENVFVRF